MKKIFYLFLILLYASTGYSQNDLESISDIESNTESGGLYLGVKLGAGFNSLKISDVVEGTTAGGDTEDAGTSGGEEEETGSIIGGLGGIFAIYEFNENIAIEVDVLYNLQGGERQNLDQEFILGDIVSLSRLNRRIYFHNLEVPVVARVGVKNFKILLGGAYAFNLAAWEVQDKNYKMSDNTYFLYKDQYENVRSEYKQHQIGAIIGASYDTRLDDRLISVELRYRHGLNDLNNRKAIIATEVSDGEDSTSPDNDFINSQLGEVFTRSFTLNIGISIF